MHIKILLKSLKKALNRIGADNKALKGFTGAPWVKAEIWDTSRSSGVLEILRRIIHNALVELLPLFAIVLFRTTTIVIMKSADSI